MRARAWLRTSLLSFGLLAGFASAAFAQDPPAPEAATATETVRSALITVAFGDSGTAPTPPSAAALDSLAPTLNLFPARHYELHAYFCPGHDSGAAQRAAGERMKAVGNFLVANGVPTGNIAAVKAGYAEAGACARVAIVAVDAQPYEATPDDDVASVAATESDTDDDATEPELAEAVPPTELPRIAVYVTGDVPDNEKSALGTRMLAALVKSGRYTGIERSESFLAEVDKELIKQHSGAIDDSEVSELGKQFGVKFICIAAITPAFGTFQISAHIVNVETAEVAFIGESYSMLQSADDLKNVSDEVVTSMFDEERKESQERTKLKKLKVGANFSIGGSGAAIYDMGAVALFLINNNMQLDLQFNYRFGDYNSSTDFSGVSIPLSLQFSTDYRRKAALYAVSGVGIDYLKNEDGHSVFNSALIVGGGVALWRCVHLDVIKFNIGTAYNSWMTGLRVVF